MKCVVSLCCATVETSFGLSVDLTVTARFNFKLRISVGLKKPHMYYLRSHRCTIQSFAHSTSFCQYYSRLHVCALTASHFDASYRRGCRKNYKLHKKISFVHGKYIVTVQNLLNCIKYEGSPDSHFIAS